VLNGLGFAGSCEEKVVLTNKIAEFGGWILFLSYP
jgi:hypothetical protein